MHLLKQTYKICEAVLIDDHITMAKDECTGLAKANKHNAKCISADCGHSTGNSVIGALFIQRTKTLAM